MDDRPGRFRRQNRLSTPADFQLVFKSKLRSADSLFVVLARRNGRPHARLGCALSRRRLASGVARNKVKRLIRESFRLHQVQLNGLDIVVLAQRDIGALANEILRASLHRHWENIAACENS